MLADARDDDGPRGAEGIERLDDGLRLEQPSRDCLVIGQREPGTPLVELAPPGGPVGLDTMATSLSEEPETIEDVHEPYLIQVGFLARTARGRVATELAYRHLGLTPPEPGPQQTRLL